ncbi:MAG: helix-turn-helix domain-containing protein [Ruminococcaceae bacterium]|nr:helix-turn-helix domain-containing protein [Oscillospiraceae bacterium]
MSGTIYKFEREMLKGEDIHIQKKQNHTWYKKHWHNYFEIIYYKNCVGYCTLNGVKHDLSKSCLFFLTPKDFHEIVTRETDNSHSIIISFSEQIVDKKLLDALTEKPIVLYDLPALLRDQIEELSVIFCGKTSYREQYLKHLLNCVLIRILETGQPLSVVSKDISPIVRESICYMLTNPAEHITLDTFAAKFGITKTYFSHLFHDSTGVSFKKYLTALRMECAKRMLCEKELSIIDVGFECGFLTPSQFVRSFKNHVGLTPSEYRARKDAQKPQDETKNI